MFDIHVGALRERISKTENCITCTHTHNPRYTHQEKEKTLKIRNRAVIYSSITDLYVAGDGVLLVKVGVPSISS